MSELILNTAMYKMRPWSRRSNRGSQIVEFGPALFLVLIIGLFPILDLVYIGLAYCCGWCLNQMEAREAAISIPPTQTSPPPYSYLKSAGNFATLFPELYLKEEDFFNTGMAHFIGIQETECQIHQDLSTSTSNANGWAIGRSDVTTTIEVEPLLAFKSGFFNRRGTASLNIPGLTTALSFQYYAQQQQEQQLQAGM